MKTSEKIVNEILEMTNKHFLENNVYVVAKTYYYDECNKEVLKESITILQNYLNVSVMQDSKGFTLMLRRKSNQ